MLTDTFALKGTICYSISPQELSITPNSYLICSQGKCAGIFPVLPEKYRGIPCTDYKDDLIIPGLTDLHVHAPQYTFRASGMDLELLDWLNTYAFPQEARYENLEFARSAYSIFAEDMKKSPNTRACIFGTLHVPATELLMELMDKTGLKTMIGKVNMDRNGSTILQETSAEASAQATVTWIEDTLNRFENTTPILTPRFTPACTDQLMAKLSQIQKKYHLPMQSHLSENFGEIEWVKELCPGTHFYGEAYHQFQLFGGDCPTIMAHCVHSSEEELALMKKQGVYVAHCPQSNTNLSSGIAPARHYLEAGLHIGLGSDIAGGTSLSILRAMADAIQVSKLYWRLVDSSAKPLTLEEAFYLGTEGGGSFFGKVGSFREGYEFDAVILNSSTIPTPLSLSPKDRLERLVYLSDDRNITGKYVSGRKIL
nr:amidohydrolase family protein [uncultured Blautia sp.]